MIAVLTIRKSTLCIAAIASSLFLISQEFKFTTKNNLPRYLQHTEKNQTRHQQHNQPTPNSKIIYTFIQPMKNRKPGHLPLPPKTQNMIETWKHAWSIQGWEPRVLTLEDARRHPEFEALSKSIDQIPLGPEPYYDKICYMRYIAMAAIGGGFMSDYDTIPLVPPPKDWSEEVGDRFTVYQQHVPALVSGSRSEYERMIRAMIKSGIEKGLQGNVTLWSDMLALKELHIPYGENFESKQAILGASKFMLGESIPMSVCEKIKKSGVMGIHFSHWDMKNGGLSPESVGKERPIVIRSWLRIYEEQCQIVTV